jgi:hypothetical protein
MSYSSPAYRAANQLTEAEHTALRALEDAPSFFPGGAGAFSYAWQARKAELDAVRLQPYADVLFADMRQELTWMKAGLTAALKAKIATARHPREIKVPFRAFFSTHERGWPGFYPDGSEGWKAMVQFGREEYVRAQTILDNDWDARIGVMHVEEWDEDRDGCESCYGGDEDAGRKAWLLPPERTYKIVKKTDLLQRLGTVFGPNFRVTLDSESEWREVNGRDYLVYRNTFHLHYMPWPALHHEKALAATLVKYAGYTGRVLGPMERVVGLQGEKVSDADAAALLRSDGPAW